MRVQPIHDCHRRGADEQFVGQRVPEDRIRLALEKAPIAGLVFQTLAESGLKTFETATRNTIDLASIALAKELSHLPVVADPSHGTGKQSLIAAVSRAAIAVGADGIIVEVHPCPERALSDGPQSLDLEQFGKVMRGLSDPLRPLVGSRAHQVA